MDLCEQYYKKVISAIGWAMVIFWAFLQIFGVLIGLIALLLVSLPITVMGADIIYQLSYAVGYLLSFMLPVAFLRLFLKRGGCVPSSMRVAPRISPWLVPILFGAIAICFAAARLNAAIVSIFDYARFSSEVLWGEGTELQGYEIVLNFIVMAIVPGFCEEFLFRGAILENLKPFGRTNAIMISALLFAAMHQNVEQFLYTFVAGIVLGLVYEKTGSIWNCTLLHIINNFISVLETTFYNNLGDSFEGNMAILLLEATVFFLGAISIGILIVRFFSDQDRKLRDGMFGIDLPASDGYAMAPLAQGRAARLFCRPSMLLYLGLCALQAGLLVIMAIGGFY